MRAIYFWNKYSGRIKVLTKFSLPRFPCLRVMKVLENRAMFHSTRLFNLITEMMTSKQSRERKNHRGSESNQSQAAQPTHPAESGKTRNPVGYTIQRYNSGGT